MALRSNLQAQLGVKAETTWGTWVTPTRFNPLRSESLTEEVDRIESEGIVAGRRTLTGEQWDAGNVTVAGDLQMELYKVGLGPWLKAMFGAVATSGAGPYTHLFTPGDLSDDSLSIQVGIQRVDGTTRPYSFAGCMVNEWELGISSGERATLGCSVVGKNMVLSEALATASFPTGSASAFTFLHAGVTLDEGGGAAAVKVREGTVAGNNGLDTDRRNIGTAYIDQPAEAELREYTAELTMEYAEDTWLDVYRDLDGAEVDLVLAFADGTDELNVTMHCRIDGDPPQVEGRGLTTHSLRLKGIGNPADEDACSIEYVTATATPV